MPRTSGQTKTSGTSIRTGLTLSLALASLVAVTVPSRAGNGAAEIIDSVGRLINPPNAPAPAPAPAQQTKILYYPAPAVHQKIIYVPAQRPAPRNCKYEKTVDFDGRDYIHSKTKVCDSPRPAPRNCWYEGRSVFDGRDYIHSKVKVCR